MDDLSQIRVVKANGESEPFIKEKLESSLFKAGAKEEVIDEIVSEIAKKLRDGMSTSNIYREAFSLLKRKSKPAAITYSLRRAIMNLGPTGFPFERYVSFLLESNGFETLVDQKVMGNCVPHEIDIVAWNEDKLVMAEAKFHNELGLKSDLKVALYVKARMDDLRGVKYDYGKERFVDEGWLITNTKFTETAIHYAECNNLYLIGWNHPKKGNLQEMIIKSRLHPLTCLTTLSESQKKILLNRGIVLCKTLVSEPDVLHSLGFNADKMQKVLKEIELLQ